MEVDNIKIEILWPMLEYVGKGRDQHLGRDQYEHE